MWPFETREESRRSLLLWAVCLILAIDERSDGGERMATWPNLPLELMGQISLGRD